MLFLLCCDELVSFPAAIKELNKKENTKGDTEHQPRLLFLFLSNERARVTACGKGGRKQH